MLGNFEKRRTKISFLYRLSLGISQTKVYFTKTRLISNLCRVSLLYAISWTADLATTERTLSREVHHSYTRLCYTPWFKSQEAVFLRPTMMAPTQTKCNSDDTPLRGYNVINWLWPEPDVPLVSSCSCWQQSAWVDTVEAARGTRWACVATDQPRARKAARMSLLLRRNRPSKLDRNSVIFHHDRLGFDPA